MKTNLALVVTGNFYQAKAYYEELLKELNLDSSENPTMELLPSILKRFKLEGPVSYFEITLDDFLDKTCEVKTKTLRFSRFPSVNRDLTIKLSEATPYQDVYDALENALKATDLIYKITPVSIYEPQENPEKTKNLSFHLVISSEDKTLNGTEISDIMNEITSKITKTVGGEII